MAEQDPYLPRDTIPALDESELTLLRRQFTTSQNLINSLQERIRTLDGTIAANNIAWDAHNANTQSELRRMQAKFRGIDLNQQFQAIVDGILNEYGINDDWGIKSGNETDADRVQALLTTNGDLRKRLAEVEHSLTLSGQVNDALHTQLKLKDGQIKQYLEDNQDLEDKLRTSESEKVVLKRRLRDSKEEADDLRESLAELTDNLETLLNSSKRFKSTSDEE